MARRKEAAQEESLFRAQLSAGHPLADRMRPQSLDELVGQQHLLGPGKLLSQMVAGRTLHSVILWGPPGTGKTTLAILLARQSGAVFRSIAAVSSGVAELREIAELARHEATVGRRTVLFIDEIHRWNRAQQDACLPHVENGLLTLIGATTENPSFEVIAPLLSRMQVLVLKPLAPEEIAALVNRALADRGRGMGALELRIDDPAMGELMAAAAGDARRALNTLEIAAELARQVRSGVITAEHVREAGQQRMLLYDRSGEEHYNVISAFIKSLRGSDADAAIYWMMRMVEAGEEPLFIARRMVIFAAEDIGNADPRALQVAIAVKDALEFVGMPEGAIPLAQGVTYLAGAPKSNAAYRAMLAAGEDARKLGALPVPMHIRNAPTALMRRLGYGENYRYPHNYQDAIVEQDYLPDDLRGKTYYEPSERGYEARIRDYLARVKQARTAHDRAGDKKK
ncbi:MAG TPA: replication-associated recombination protein A [Candidatus Binataceae bacterium]|nr:replication-associated recombination protein A [Candidatus Binataceae bacterium]